MLPCASIFQECNLPNATTWFYFALLLAVALFFKFSRWLSLRNWDLLTLFLLVPGLLLRQEAASVAPEADVGKPAAPPTAENGTARTTTSNLHWFAYLWLLCGSGYFLIRCLADLALVRRPALSPNLNLGGLAWLGLALLACLVAIALRRSGDAADWGNRLPLSDDTGAHGATLLWLRRCLAIAGHLAIVVALFVIGWRHFQDAHVGMAAAACYLVLPYTAMFFDKPQHVLPMALVLWAVAAYRLPTVAGLLLGLAAGSMYFPAVLFPAWLSFYWRRGAGRFSAAFLLAAGVVLTAIGLTLWVGGPLADEVQTALSVFDVQQWKMPSTEGFWTGVHWAYRIPVFIAYVAFVATTLVWPAPKDLAHLLALSAAVLIGIQFWFADRGGLYVLWYMPLVLLVVFRPNLAGRRPTVIHPDTDWLQRLGSGLLRLLRRTVRMPEPLLPVQ
jgi:hypothetical protein